MAGRRERERKERQRYYDEVLTSTTFRFVHVDPPWHFEPSHNPLGDGYSPWTGEWFRDPPPGQPFTCDIDGTIILHPSQWKVVA